VTSRFPQRAYNPATATGGFVLKTSDPTKCVILPGVAARVHGSIADKPDAMVARLYALRLAQRTPRQIDPTIGGVPGFAAPFQDEMRCKDAFVVAARPHHPACARPPSGGTFTSGLAGKQLTVRSVPAQHRAGGGWVPWIKIRPPDNFPLAGDRGVQ
jgi:hypothetical protein